jgi:GT2 family glycosyltransferase
MTRNRISVLIACYQHGHWLGGALASVFAQTHADMEAVVANDGSTDSTPDVVREWQRRKPGRVILVETARAGQAAARAAALDRADGEFYITLDADDLLEPRMAEKTLAALASHPEAAVAAADVWMVDESGRRALRRLRQNRQPEWPSVLDAHPLGGVAGLLVRTEAARRIGGLTMAGTPGAEDWDFAVRLARSGLRTVPVPEALARYRQSQASFSRNPIPMLRTRLELLDRCRKPDPRLPGPPERQPKLDEAEWSRYRNRQVFFILGLAASGSSGPLAEILSFRVPGPVELELWANAFAHGACHAALGGLPAGGAAARAEEALRSSLEAMQQAAWAAPLQRMMERAMWRMRFPGPRALLGGWAAWQATARFRRGRGA